MASTSAAAMASSTPMPNPTVIAPPSPISPTDHGAIILITNAFGLILVVIFGIVRLCVRFFISPPFDKDDYVLFSATAFCVIYSSLIFAMVSKGFGSVLATIAPSDLLSLQKLNYASDFFYLLTLWASKCSMALIFIRLSPDKKLNKFAKGVLVASTVWLVGSIFVIALRCELSQPWIFVHEKCTNLLLRWQIVSALDIVIEAALFAMSMVLVWDLKMRLARKIYVVTAFAIRLPIIAAIVLRLHYLQSQVVSSDPTFTGVFFIVWSVVEIDFGLCTLNIACLKPFVAAFNTSYGGSAEINALERGTRYGLGSKYGFGSKYGGGSQSGSGGGGVTSASRSTSGGIKTLLSSAQRSRATSRKRKEAESGMGSASRISSTAGDDYDMAQLPKGETIDAMLAKGRANGAGSQGARKGQNGGDATNRNPMADAGVGSKHSNTVDITHEDADSIGSYGSRQMIIQKQVGWSVESADKTP